MPGEGHGRRSFLATVAAVSTGAVGGRASAAETGQGGDTNACPLRDDLDRNHQTPTLNDIEDPHVSLNVEKVDSKSSGPTAFVVGGIHGDERAGIVAAHDIAKWSPDYGQMVVVPEANPQAIKQNSRTNENGDLNRKFMYRKEPTSRRAQAIWKEVTASKPDVVFTLQESRGVFRGRPSGVGQAVFHSPTSTATDAARMGIRRANRTIGEHRLKFDHASISGPHQAPNGLLTEKTTYETGTDSFIIETYEGVNEPARVRWQKRITKGILDYYDLYD